MAHADPDLAGESIAAPIEPVRFDARELNHAANPRDDLDAFVNAHWCRENPIPSGYSCWDCFSILNARALRLQAEIAVDCARAGESGSDERRIVGDLWATATDSGEGARNGLESLRGHLQAIHSLDAPESIAAYVSAGLTRGDDLLFSVDVQPDFADPGVMIVFVVPQALGLPDRDLYFDATPAGVTLLAAYAAHIAAMLELCGWIRADAQRKATDVVEFERRLAQVCVSRRTLARDVTKRYNPVSVAAAERLSPEFSWGGLFASAGLRPGKFSLSIPEFHAQISHLLRTVPVQTWQAYLGFHTIDRAAPLVGDEFARAHDHFHGSVLRGRQSCEPRWKRALRVLNGNVGEAMGRLYAERHCLPETYARIEGLVEELREAMRERIESLGWMGATTKQSALRKLAVFTAKIGCPSQWRDWSGLTTGRHSLYENVMAARAFNRTWAFAQAGKCVDQSLWSLTPQTVNARYDPQRNEILLPAAILQPPFFDPEADAALNYGGIGAVIAHEMIHGYDDQGSRFGADGRFENWWSGDDRARFDALAAQMVERFNQCAWRDGEPVDGFLTLGENIADVGGLALACSALRRSIATHRRCDPMLDGFSQLQRFFFNWAVLWRQNLTPDERRLRAKTDPHAPGNVRAHVAAASVAEFVGAFADQATGADADSSDACQADVRHETADARIW